MRLQSIALAALAVTAVAVDPPSAHAATQSEQAGAILTNVAAHVSHGFKDYSTPYETDEQIIASGGHVSVLCGQVSLLGIRALNRAGIPARSVGAFAAQRADLMDVPSNIVESHAMLEAWTGSRWELYDLDSNVQPVDENGGPVTIQQFADMPARHYRVLATDALYDPTDDQYPLYEQWVFANHEAWYDRVLDIVAIHQPASSAYVFSGPTGVVDGLPGYVRVSREALDAWSVEGPYAPAPKPAAPQPVQPVQPVAAPVATAVASPALVAPAPVPVPVNAKPRFVTKTRHGKVFHVYGTGRKARWVYVRRAR